MTNGHAVGPWTRLNRTTVYENPWVIVHHDDVLRPNGTAGIYGVVSFREQAVGVVPIGDDGRILLVGQHRYTLDAYSWEIPEGGVGVDEDPLAGARRELAEETGYRASTWRLLVPRFSLANSVGDQIGSIFVATGLTAGTATPEPTEEIATRWITLEEGLEMIDRGAIDDSVTQVALLRLQVERHA